MLVHTCPSQCPASASPAMPRQMPSSCAAGRGYPCVEGGPPIVTAPLSGIPPLLPPPPLVGLTCSSQAPQPHILRPLSTHHFRQAQRSSWAPSLSCSTYSVHLHNYLHPAPLPLTRLTSHQSPAGSVIMRPETLFVYAFVFIIGGNTEAESHSQEQALLFFFCYS